MANAVSEMSVGEMFARGAAFQLYDVLKRLNRDCTATDFNEHWESFTDSEEILKDYKVSFDPSTQTTIINLEAELTRHRRIFDALLKGIHTDKVDAQITMGLADQHLNPLDVLEREAGLKPNKTT